MALGSDEWLLQFLFHHKEQRLRESPAALLEEAEILSHQQYVLIQCALDLWNGQGGAKLSAILEVLDDENFLRLARALLYSRGIGEDVWLRPERESC